MPTKDDYLKILLNEINGLDFNDKKYPEVSEIKKILGDDKRRTAEQDKLTMYAFDYLNNHKFSLTDGLAKRNYDTIFSLLAVCDGEVAKNFMKDVNSDPLLLQDLQTMKILGGVSENRKLPLEPEATMRRLDVRPLKNEGADLSENTAKEDLTITNLKTLYEVMTKDADPILHVNSKAYKDMVKSIGNTLDYIKQNPKNADKKVVKEMLKVVSEKTAKYIQDKDVEPTTKLGKTRLNAAFAALFTVDESKAQALLDSNNSVIRQHSENIAKIMGSGLTPRKDKYHGGFTKEDIISKAGIHNLDKATKMDRLAKDVKDAKERAIRENDRANVIPRMKALGEYVVKRGLLEQLKNSTKDFEINKSELDSKILLFQARKEFSGPFFNLPTDGSVDCDKFYKDVCKGAAEQKALEERNHTEMPKDKALADEIKKEASNKKIEMTSIIQLT